MSININTDIHIDINIHTNTNIHAQALGGKMKITPQSYILEVSIDPALYTYILEYLHTYTRIHTYVHKYIYAHTHRHIHTYILLVLQCLYLEMWI
jgi:hypothetical protein